MQKDIVQVGPLQRGDGSPRSCTFFECPGPHQTKAQSRNDKQNDRQDEQRTGVCPVNNQPSAATAYAKCHYGDRKKSKDGAPLPVAKGPSALAKIGYPDRHRPPDEIGGEAGKAT